MSTRIHKAVGYGMLYTGLHALFDRLDQDGVDGEVGTLIREAKALEIHKNRNLFLEDEDFANANYSTETNFKYARYFHECLKSATFDEDDGYLLVIPPIHIHDWFRWDCIIDYCENSDDADNDYTPKIKLLDKPIHPYRDWMNPETFEDIPFDEYYALRPKAVPAIPLSVKLISDKIGIDWKQLKPMVATWWS